tara:strand:- start:39 stop:983 length:945 start_codon:yes stop_codon:yes gene_type:complete
MKTLLVLGGSGFIGQAILKEFYSGKLKKFGIGKIILVSRNIHKLKKKFIKKNIIYKSLDLSKTKKIPNANIIIHAAENSIKKKNIYNFKKDIKISSNTTENIVKILKKIKKKKIIIYLSSGAVYGSNNKIKKINESKKIFTQKLIKNNLKNLYAKNKINSEKKILQLKNFHQVIILRLFSFVGNNIPENSNYILGNIKKVIKNKKKLTLKSNNILKTYRSFMSTDDLIMCIFKIIKKENNVLRPIFNVGSDKSILLIDLIKKLSKKFKFKYEINENQINKIDFYVPSVRKIQKIINHSFKQNTFKLIINYLSTK